MDIDDAKKYGPSDSANNDGNQEEAPPIKDDSAVDDQKKDDEAVTPKKGPSDGSEEDEDENNFGIKKGPSDGSEEEKIKDDKQENSDASDEERSKEAQIVEEDEKFDREFEEMEKKKKEQEDRRKEELEKIYEAAKKRREREEKSGKKQEILGGIVTKIGKAFSHENEEGVFRHEKLNNFGTVGVVKMQKTLKKVHGIPLKKKLEFINAVKTYNSYSPSGKTVLRKETLEEFARKIRSKNYSGTKFERMKKELNPRTLKFKKKEIDKITRELTGKEDPRAYKRQETKSAINKSAQKKSASNSKRSLF